MLFGNSKEFIFPGDPKLSIHQIVLSLSEKERKLEDNCLKLNSGNLKNIVELTSCSHRLYRTKSG